MKARKVRGLDPRAPLVENARRIVRVRVDELYSFAPRALRPGNDATLHDMRIAAKRLRYVLELTSFCFGPYATRATAIARDLQDAIGAIHDCDVLEPRLLEHLASLRAEDAHGLAGAAIAASAKAPGQLPATRRRLYASLDALVVEQAARRELLFARFAADWQQLERDRFRRRLLESLNQPPLAVAPVAA